MGVPDHDHHQTFRMQFQCAVDVASDQGVSVGQGMSWSWFEGEHRNSTCPGRFQQLTVEVVVDFRIVEPGFWPSIRDTSTEWTEADVPGEKFL